jgi:hypothetical protein
MSHGQSRISAILAADVERQASNATAGTLVSVFLSERKMIDD